MKSILPSIRLNDTDILHITNIELSKDSFPYVEGYIESILPLHVNCLCVNLKDPIDKVIFNNPAVIVFWKDGTKTVVKCGPDDIFDPEKGLAMAIAKKHLGNKGNYNNILKKHLKEVTNERNDYL